MNKIHYRKGYKYQLAENFIVQLKNIRTENKIVGEFFCLRSNGRLDILSGYSSDGASGPTIDTKSFMRASFVHDVLYQMIRMGLLPSSYREKADKELYLLCREDGMNRFRAWYVLRSLRKFGKAAADPKNKKKVFTAP